MASLDTYTHAPIERGYGDLRMLMSLMTGDEKHSEAATSTLDVIWTLYDRVLRIDPRSPDDRDRDRFYLSKGHGPMAYYAVLAAKGFIDIDALSTFGTFDSALGHHPDRTLVSGVEISSGSLGHGLPLAVGSGIALDLDHRRSRIFVLMGDGELDEGSNHEAIAIAGRRHMSRLTAIVIDNDSSHLGWPSGIGSRFEVEGWRAVKVDGRDHDAIDAALNVAHPDRPLVVIAKVGRKYG